ncbi:MHYT domain-containing protein [Cohnella suwonensis]|uniref:histidine kinase n=1 Tax=Cohnella suwonensis TaxID=696072 RepID=A0ABW0M5L6_9BACL
MESMHGSYDTMLVVFSYIVAVAASYAVLDMAGMVSSSTGRNRWLWLLFGGVSMGMGIWSMHFVGMLAFSLPVKIAYDLVFVLLSVLAAIIASFIALYVVSRRTMTIGRLLRGGLLFAAGISAMHYTGMYAMQIDITYDLFLFSLSILIALVASIAALWLSFYFGKGGKRGIGWKKFGSGLIMGAAIVGMHYTGMMASHFHYGAKTAMSSGIVLDQKWLAYFIAGGTLFTLGLSVLGAYISKRFTFKDLELRQKQDEIFVMNQELLQLNENLERLVEERTAQLARAHDEAIHANMIKSQFLANMSHELRTPLNAIIGYSEMLIEDAEDLNEPTFANDLGKIASSGQNLLSIINDILDISKIEAGKVDVYLEPCKVGDVAQDVLTMVKPLVAGNNNRLVTSLAEGEMKTDVTKLRQILLNLLSNANKFSKEGTILFEAKPESRDGKLGFAFVVKDTGIGMSKEQVGRLFQPFTQADSSTTRKYGGTGLGLAISQRFCALLGGDIRIESVLGEGSTFKCWLPVDPQGLPEVPEQPASSRSPEEESLVGVLLIDDEPINQQILSRFLAKEGWTLAFAESGVEGLRLARELRPQVICLDILMPSMDGWNVLSMLKSDPELADIPVIILSMTSDKQLGYSLGASEFLMKPVRQDRLLEALVKYVDRQAARRQSVLLIEETLEAEEGKPGSGKGGAVEEGQPKRTDLSREQTRRKTT